MAKTPRHRSPNYPYLDLEVAVAKAEVLYGKVRQHSTPFAMVAKHLGYTPKSSSAQKSVAAIKKYGLIDDDGKGDSRQIKLSDLGLRIVRDKRPDSADRLAGLREAALLPSLFKQFWDRWGSTLPTDDDIQFHLVHDLEFNEDAAASLISTYKSTLAFASLTGNAIIDEHVADNSDGEIREGDYVQWTSQGVAHFPEPRRILGLSDCRSFAFVEGTEAGIPVDQLSKCDEPTGAQGATKTPPSNPHYRPPQPEGPSLILDLPRDNKIEIRLRSKMTPDEFGRFLKAFRMSAFGLVDGDIEDPDE